MLRHTPGTQLVQHVLGRLGLSSGGHSWDSLFSLVDQGVVSGVTFLVTVVLGRWCGADELGAYSLGFTVLVFMIAAQMAIISIPYTNQWRRLPEGERKDFAGCALIQHLLFAAVAAGVIAAVGLALWMFGFRERINSVILVLAAVVPLYLVREFSRRHAFAHLQIRAAMALDLCVALLQIGGLVGLFLTDSLGAVSAFVVLGLGAGTGGVLALFLARNSFSFRFSMLKRAMGQHWRFGRWVLAATSVGVIHGYLIHWLLAILVGTAETGVFAACMLVVLVISPFRQGVGNILEPRAAKAFARGGHAALRSMVWRVSLAVSAIMLAFCTAAAVFGGWLVTVLYAGPEYAGHGHLVFILALYAAAGVIDLGAATGLRAMDHPSMNFRAACISLVGIILVSSHGILGGAIALLVGELCSMSIRIGAFVQLSSASSAEVATLSPASE